MSLDIRVVHQSTEFTFIDLATCGYMWIEDRSKISMSIYVGYQSTIIHLDRFPSTGFSLGSMPQWVHRIPPSATCLRAGLTMPFMPRAVGRLRR